MAPPLEEVAAPTEAAPSFWDWKLCLGTPVDRVESDVFELAGFKWRVLAVLECPDRRG